AKCTRTEVQADRFEEMSTQRLSTQIWPEPQSTSREQLLVGAVDWFEATGAGAGAGGAAWAFSCGFWWAQPMNAATAISGNVASVRMRSPPRWVRARIAPGVPRTWAARRGLARGACKKSEQSRSDCSVDYQLLRFAEALGERLPRDAE